MNQGVQLGPLVLACATEHSNPPSTSFTGTHPIPQRKKGKDERSRKERQSSREEQEALAFLLFFQLSFVFSTVE
jgi:hypothetical protein